MINGFREKLKAAKQYVEAAKAAAADAEHPAHHGVHRLGRRRGVQVGAEAADAAVKKVPENLVNLPKPCKFVVTNCPKDSILHIAKTDYHSPCRRNGKPYRLAAESFDLHPP